MKIISGGQTGVDRAALDVALKYGIECGGWCPAGRLDELGRIPDIYPVKELPKAGFAERTAQNVIDSDATVIFCSRKIEGGTEQTLRSCLDQKRQHLIVDATKTSIDEAVRSISDFLRTKQIATLNVAGPRQSEWPGGYDYAFGVLEIIARINTRSGDTVFR